MARRRRNRSRRSYSGFGNVSCGCPSGSRKISTRGGGRGWVCQSTSMKSMRVRGKMRRMKPFVKALC